MLIHTMRLEYWTRLIVTGAIKGTYVAAAVAPTPVLSALLQI